MTRSTNIEKIRRLNAAFDLLARGYAIAEAAALLSKDFGLSRRQSYRYLQEAQEIDKPLSVSAPNIPITIKIRQDVVDKLRAYAQANGMTIGDVVAQAVLGLLAMERRYG